MSDYNTEQQETMMQRLRSVLADPEWTTGVVVAAIMAEHMLNRSDLPDATLRAKMVLTAAVSDDPS